MSDKQKNSISQLLAAMESAEIGALTDPELGREFEEEWKKQDLGFRDKLFRIVTWMMVCEVAAMFLIVILQGFGGFSMFGFTWSFELEHWVLASFEAGVLLQTFALAKIITKNLFNSA